MPIFKAIYAAVLVAFDRSIFNGGDHKCLDKTDIIIGDAASVFHAHFILMAATDDLKEIREYFSAGLRSAYSAQQVHHTPPALNGRRARSAAPRCRRHICDVLSIRSSTHWLPLTIIGSRWRWTSCSLFRRLI